jgi:hypothetical protein
VNIENIPSVAIDSLAAGLTFNASIVNTPSVNIENIPSVAIDSLAAGLTFNASIVNTPSVNIENIPSVAIDSLAAGLTFNASIVNTPSVNIENIPSVEIDSVLTTSVNATIVAGSSGVTLTADTSQQRFVSYYINNNPGNAALTAWLQISPINVDAYFTDDTATYFQVPAGSMLVIATKYYLDFTRLSWNAGTGTASFIAYYNARI